ncbi:MAG: PAS domain-containing protein [Candidatus Zixiibacteriota bacterium]|nr:MAG: PAS domain-containing protein [candidate division Zixibacteria bacterium]
MNSKQKAFSWEIRLGLALIVLVLVVLNFASHYTLYRVRESIEERSKDELSEAAVVIANSILRGGEIQLLDSVVKDVTYTYNLDCASVFHLGYERVLAIQRGEPLDTLFAGIGLSPRAEDLAPLLRNHPVYIHKPGAKETYLLFPAESVGSKYVICVANQNPLLGSVESAGRILIFFAILGILVIAYVASKFARLVLYPFKRLREKAEESGRFDATAGDEVSGLISSYEQIINDLRVNEKELVRLNRMITRKAQDLEVYNDYILKSIPTGIITLDAEHRISTVNSAVEHILNLESHDYRGQTYTEFFAKFEELRHVVEVFIQSSGPVNNEKVSIVGHDGKIVVLAVSISWLTDGCGDRIGFSVLLNNQTELEKLQEELELKRRMASLGEMAGGLAHQLRNSAAAMVGFANLIVKKLAPESVARENADLLLKESREVEALLARFLDFARPLKPALADVNLCRLIEEIIRVVQPSYPNVSLRRTCDPASVPTIAADELLLKQAVTNIVDNACRAFDGGRGEVEVTIEPSGAFVRIAIADNGPGIPEKYHDRIFTPFFSGSPSGVGLGLPLARKIVMLHNGQLDFESRLTSGTRFDIALPLTKDRPHPADQAAAQQPTA